MPLPTDTLTYDLDKIARYQADPRYDYNSQLLPADTGWWDAIVRRISSLLRRLFHQLDSDAAQTVSTWLLVLLFVLLLAAVFFFIWKKRPGLFLRDKKLKDPYDVITEADLYATDFDRALADALAQSDYRAAVRLLYLQTLRTAADREWVDWQIFKTPTEYALELRPQSLRSPFRNLTNAFLRIRYGNYRATPELFERMRSLQQQILKGE